MDNGTLSLAIVRALVVFAIFLLPGYGWVAWLHGRDRLALPLRAALAFAWSFLAFALVGWPFLWFGGSFQVFLSVLYPIWGLVALVAAVAYTRPRPAGRPALGNERHAVAESADPLPEPTVTRACSLLGVYLAVAGVAGATWVLVELPLRHRVLYFLAALLPAGYLTARYIRTAAAGLLAFGQEDDQPAPPLWVAAAVVLVGIQAVSAVVYDRPDWDDCFNLAAVLDYQEATTLNEQEPTYREGLPMPVIYRAMCWELWGAVVCHLSGLSPMVLYHSLLPGILVLLAYGAYTGLLGAVLPRRWVPLALLGLSAYHLWGISGHEAASNYLLPRPWQSKSVLLNVGVPLAVTLVLRFLARPVWRSWLSLTVVLAFGMALSFSALFMEVILVTCLGLAAVPALQGRRLSRLLPVAAALFPVLVCGLAVRTSLHGVVQAAQTSAAGSVVRPLHVHTWFAALNYYTMHGCAEILWLLSLPLLAVFLGGVRRGVYLVGFPVVLGLTFAHPALFDQVATHVSSYPTYLRIWWLFPVGAGLGALLALVTRFLTAAAGLRGQSVAPLVLASAGLLASAALPGLYVWSPRNSFIGPLGTPHLAENPEKMPGDLLQLAELLLRDPDVKGSLLLCNEQVASFLNAYSRDFRFVMPRHSYRLATPEGLERFLLARILYEGRTPDQVQEWDLAHWRNLFGPDVVEAVWDGLSATDLPDTHGLMQRHGVRYVLTGPGDRALREFQRLPCSVVCRQGAFVLWRTPVGLEQAPTTPGKRLVQRAQQGT